MNDIRGFIGSGAIFCEDKENATPYGQLMIVLLFLASIVVVFVSLRKPQHIPSVYPLTVFVVFLGYIFQGPVVAGGFLVFFTFVSAIGVLVSATFLNKIVMFSAALLMWAIFLILMKYQNVLASFRGRYMEQIEMKETLINDIRLNREEIRKKSLAYRQLITNYERMVSFLKKSASNVFVGVEGFFKELSSSDYFGADALLVFGAPHTLCDFISFGVAASPDAEFVVSPDSRKIVAKFIDSRQFAKSSDLSAADADYSRYEWGLFEKKSGRFSDDDKRFISIAVDFARAAVANIILYEKTQKLSIVDGLTGLFLRGYFMERFAEEFALAVAHRLPLAVLMIDLDNFKKLNDEFGHSAGDEALRMVARVLKNRLRETDIVARYGGEEFVAAMPHTNLASAISTAEDLRLAIGKEKFFVGGESRTDGFKGQYATITVSIGAAEFLPALDFSVSDIIARADEKLYEAKKSGKNRIIG